MGAVRKGNSYNAPSLVIWIADVVTLDHAPELVTNDVVPEALLSKKPWVYDEIVFGQVAFYAVNVHGVGRPVHNDLRFPFGRRTGDGVSYCI